MILKVCAINNIDNQKHMYPIDHLFILEEKLIKFIDYEGKDIVKPVNWDQTTIVFGRENTNNTLQPDIYFNPKAMSVNRRQFRLSYRNIKSKEYGFYINDLFDGELTCLKIEKKPYVVEAGMLYMLSGHYLMVEEINPPIMNIDIKAEEFYHVSLDSKDDEDILGNNVTAKNKSITHKKKNKKHAENEEKDEKIKKKKLLLTPFIKLKFINTPYFQNSITIKALRKKEKLDVTIGSDCKCDVVLKQLSRIQMKFKFNYDLSLWFAVTDEDCIENDSKINYHNYLVLREAIDLLSEEDMKIGPSVRLQKGMKIGFDCNELEVMEDGR